MPKVTEAHLEARRQQILDAARACFSRNGFHQTTMQDICRQAELSPGAVYRYFDSKEAIIEATCEEGQRQAAAAFEAASGQGDTLKVFGELVDVFYGRMDEAETDDSARMSVQLWGEALRNPGIDQVMRGHWHGILARIKDIISNAQERGEINPDLDASAVARVLMATYDGLVVQKAMDRSLVDVRKYIEALRALYSGTFWLGKRPGAHR